MSSRRGECLSGTVVTIMWLLRSRISAYGIHITQAYATSLNVEHWVLSDLKMAIPLNTER